MRSGITQAMTGVIHQSNIINSNPTALAARQLIARMYFLIPM